jgi:hypothetical protein
MGYALPGGTQEQGVRIEIHSSSVPRIRVEEHYLITCVLREDTCQFKLTCYVLSNSHKKINAMKKCLSSLAIKEIEIKATLRFYHIPVRMAIIKEHNSNKCW